jgi:curved DNA-binding protein CbpA
MDFRKHYYTILEVKNSATKEEIRASYRKLAKKFHPDKNPGDASAEEKFKSINEAHEVLSNDILRHEYDEYRKQEEEWLAKQKAEEKHSSTTSAKNKRTYTRKKTVTKERRVYVRGEVAIKYWALQEEEPKASVQGEWKYRITPYDVRLNITDTNIYLVQGIPLDYLKAFKESELFKSPLSQPVKCTVKTGEDEEFYELPLYDIRIKNIRLHGITKHEGQSFGTLVGDLFAYTPKFDSYEEEEEVTECFGETGNVETKVDGDRTYCRKQFYHPDCSTYWGEWHRLTTPAPATSTAYRSAAASPVVAGGCWQWWWIPLLILFVVIFPKFFLAIIAMTFIGVLLSLGSSILSSFSRMVSVLVLALFLWSVIAGIRSFSAGGSSYVKHDAPSYDSLSTSQERVSMEKREGDRSRATEDTLIRHFIRWKDYDSTVYETTLSIALSDLRSSVAEHNRIEPDSSQNPLASVYAAMLEKNEQRMNYVYASFDSLKAVNQLNDLALAKMIVSCVQAVPYFLVVDRGCGDRYDDEFTRNYLATCDRDCCIGNEKFGVRSPAEFLYDLKGDCDTRALFLYGLLGHYKFNVALITSQYYQHAMIAVSFQNNDTVDGLALNIHNHNYYLWETTSAGLDVGHIPTYLQNLDYWDIALLNENK